MAAPEAGPADTTIVNQAVIGADYNYDGLNDGGGHANVWGGDAAGIVALTPSYSAQLMGGGQSYNFTGFNFTDWNISGTASWDAPIGRVGVNVGYDGINSDFGNVGVTNYGVYGEYYLNDQLTLGLRGGGATGNADFYGVSGSSTGGYVGGEAIGYLMPDLGVQGHVGYVSVDNVDQTNVGVKAEYLISHRTPLSGWVGYDYTSFGGAASGLNGSKFSMGLRYYFGGHGSLEQHQRTGVDTWGPSTVDFAP